MLSWIGQSNSLTLKSGCLQSGIDKLIRQPRGIIDRMQRIHLAALRSTTALIRLQQHSLYRGALFDHSHPLNEAFTWT
jgi:hypothetical protein